MKDRGFCFTLSELFNILKLDTRLTDSEKSFLINYFDNIEDEKIVFKYKDEEVK